MRLVGLVVGLGRWIAFDCRKLLHVKRKRLGMNKSSLTYGWGVKTVLNE